jgi:hypothetical protein
VLGVNHVCVSVRSSTFVCACKLCVREQGKEVEECEHVCGRQITVCVSVCGRQITVGVRTHTHL